jgi:hypothetical protein
MGITTYVLVGFVIKSCGRHGRYNVGRLMAEHGDAKLTDPFGDPRRLRQGALVQRLGRGGPSRNRSANPVGLAPSRRRT